MKNMKQLGKYQSRKWIVEAKSVNHRFLDISIKLPRNYYLLEEKIRSEVKKNIFRGRIDIYVKIQDEGEEKRRVKLDKELAKAYYSALEQVANILPVSKEVSLMDIALMPDVIVLEDAEEDLESDWIYLKEALNYALNQLVDMRIQEGEELYKDLNKKLEVLNKACGYLKNKAPEVLSEYKEKLTRKLSEAVSGLDIDENRLLTEIAIMADKISIDEEIVRLESHLKQLKKELKNVGIIGRKLDFIIQELNREINTIGSKSNNFKISNLVVEAKTCIEKMREQVQNIE
jgi:uncharacterized protein (TIGR00255 family)